MKSKKDFPENFSICLLCSGPTVFVEEWKSGRKGFKCDGCFGIWSLGFEGQKPRKKENFFFWSVPLGLCDSEMSCEEFQRLLKLRSFQ